MAESALSQAAVLDFLREHGGKVRSSLLFRRFEPLLDLPAAKPEERAALRQRFTHLVNSVAVVQDVEGVKLVVLEKRHQLALDSSDAEPRPTASGDLSGEDGETEGAGSWVPACPASFTAASSNPPGEGGPEAYPTIPVFQLKNFFQKGGAETLKAPSGKGHLAPKGAPEKPCMLPVRPVPPSSSAKRSEKPNPEQDQTRVKDGLQVGLSAILLSTSPHAKRRQLSEMGPRSPTLRRGPKALKVGEEADSTASVPLEPAEHQWVVKATAGQWSQQLHGLLLIDLNLASKRDFMSGFTVLHWAAKSGNCRTLKKVIEMAEKGGVHIDVNAKSYGGYTPLHIAAIHGQEEVIAELVKLYNAKVSLRDYSGKKPFQYLKEGSSFAVRHLLNDPGLHTITGKNPSIKKNIKVAASILTSTSTVLGLLSDDTAFYELTKGLKKPAPINKFLNIATAPRRKLKSHRTFSSSSSSLSEALEEEHNETASKHRPVSELFFGHLSH